MAGNSALAICRTVSVVIIGMLLLLKNLTSRLDSFRGGGGYSRQFRIGVCRQGSQTLTLFKGRKSRIDTLLKAQSQEMAPYLRETR